MVRATHSRDDTYHLGTDPAHSVVLGSDIGPYPAGMTVQDFIAALDAAVTAREAANHAVVSFSLAAVLAQRGFPADAILRRTIAGSAAFDAVVFRTVAGSFTADAVIPGWEFTLDAALLSAISGTFTGDAVISAGSESFQDDAFQGDTFQ